MGSADPFPSERGSLLDSGPSDFPPVSTTGDASLDEVLQTLTSMPQLDETAQHASYERLHDELLAELNTEHN